MGRHPKWLYCRHCQPCIVRGGSNEEPMKSLYKYFFRGLITILPVALTVYLLYIFLAWMETAALWILRPLICLLYTSDAADE